MDRALAFDLAGLADLVECHLKGESAAPDAGPLSAQGDQLAPNLTVLGFDLIADPGRCRPVALGRTQRVFLARNSAPLLVQELAQTLLRLVALGLRTGRPAAKGGDQGAAFFAQSAYQGLGLGQLVLPHTVSVFFSLGQQGSVFFTQGCGFFPLLGHPAALLVQHGL